MSDEKISAESRNVDPLVILKKVFAITFLLVACVIATVVAVVMSQHDFRGDEEKKQFENFAKDTHNYANDVAAKTEEKNIDNPNFAFKIPDVPPEEQEEDTGSVEQADINVKNYKLLAGRQIVPEMFDKRKIRHNVPWQKELGLVKLLNFAAMGFLIIAAVFVGMDKGKGLAIAIAGLSMVAGIVGILLSVIIGNSYGQQALGTVFLSDSLITMAAGAISCIAGLASLNYVKGGMMSFLSAKARMIFALTGMAGWMASAILSSVAAKNIDLEAAAKYCKANPTHVGCAVSVPDKGAKNEQPKQSRQSK